MEDERDASVDDNDIDADRESGFSLSDNSDLWRLQKAVQWAQTCSIGSELRRYVGAAHLREQASKPMTASPIFAPHSSHILSATMRWHMVTICDAGLADRQPPRPVQRCGLTLGFVTLRVLRWIRMALLGPEDLVRVTQNKEATTWLSSSGPGGASPYTNLHSRLESAGANDYLLWLAIRASPRPFVRPDSSLSEVASHPRDWWSPQV
jgi:hypothetical protein